MCGIIGVFELDGRSEALRPTVLEMSRKVRHRGPDWSGIYSTEKAILAHERLAIVDPKSGRQPLLDKEETVVLSINGEIYNHRELRQETPDYAFQTDLDSEVILALYKKEGSGF